VWKELNGNPQYSAGASGTVTIPKGCRILQVHAHSAGAATVAIFGGDAIPVPTTGWGWQPNHLMWVSGSAQFSGSQTIVFTGTDAYFVEWERPVGVGA
jgi:hypothetical protein